MAADDSNSAAAAVPLRDRSHRINKNQKKSPLLPNQAQILFFSTLIAYFVPEVALRLLENFDGGSSLAATLSQFKPAWSWGVAFLCLGAMFPVGSKFLFGAQFLLTASMISVRMVNVLTQKIMLFPTIASFIAMGLPYVVNLQSVSEVAAGANYMTPTLLFGIHATSVVQEMGLSIVFPAPYLCDASLASVRANYYNQKNIHKLSIPSTANNRGVALSGALLTHPQTLVQPLQSRRWIVYVGGNGDNWEKSAPVAYELMMRCNANTAVVFNFRGVCQSGGRIKHAEDLTQDLSDVIRYILSTYPHVQESDIVVFGHSLGGGVAAQVVAKHYSKLGLVLDRTFSSLTDCAVNMFGFDAHFTKFVVETMFGELDVAAVWPQLVGPDRSSKRTVVCFHRADHILSYTNVSLCRLDAVKRSGVVVELLGGSPNFGHNSPLGMLTNSDTVLQRMQSMWPTSKKLL